MSAVTHDLSSPAGAVAFLTMGGGHAISRNMAGVPGLPDEQRRVQALLAIGCAGGNADDATLQSLAPEESAALAAGAAALLAAALEGGLRGGRVRRDAYEAVQTLVPYMRCDAFADAVSGGSKAKGSSARRSALALCARLCVEQPADAEAMDAVLSLAENVATNRYLRGGGGGKEDCAVLWRCGVGAAVCGLAAHGAAAVAQRATRLLRRMLLDIRALRKHVAAGSETAAAALHAAQRARSADARQALTQLCDLAQLSRGTSAPQEPGAEAPQPQIQHLCAGCNATGKMHACSRCKSVHYCSKECQKREWRAHKLVCQDAKQTDSTTLQRMLMGYFERLGPQIKAEMGAVGRRQRARGARCDRLCDVLVVIDLMTSPRHEVLPVASVLGPPLADAMGCSPILSEWNFPGTDVWEENARGLVATVAEKHAQLGEGMVLVVLRGGDHMCMTFRLRLEAPDRSRYMYEDADVGGR